jgi:hypothetical protein
VTTKFIDLVFGNHGKDAIANDFRVFNAVFRRNVMGLSLFVLSGASVRGSRFDVCHVLCLAERSGLSLRKESGGKNKSEGLIEVRKRQMRERGKPGTIDAAFPSVVLF